MTLPYNKSILRKMREITRPDKNSDSAVHPHQRGLELFAKAEFEDAAEAFREAARREPDFFLSHYYLGATLKILGEMQAAQSAFRRAAEINSLHAPSLSNLGDLYLTQQNFTAAADFFRRALAVQPENLIALRGMGKLAKQNLADRAEVVALLKNAYEISQNTDILLELFDLKAVDFEFCTRIGDDLSAKKIFVKAAFFYRLALLKRPSESAARNKLVQMMGEICDREKMPITAE